MSIRTRPLDLAEADLVAARPAPTMYEIACPECGEVTKKLLIEAVRCDEITCSRFGHRIDIDTEDRRTAITEFVKALAEVEFSKKS